MSGETKVIRSQNRAPVFLGFLQASGLITYCTSVSLLMANASNWFGHPPSFIEPVFGMVLFMTSAVICTLLYLGYPFLLFWEHKQTLRAIKLVLFTTVWLIVYLTLFFTVLFFSKA